MLPFDLKRHAMKKLLCLLHLVLFSALSAAETLPEGIERVRSLGGIDEYRLKSNGLRILVHRTEGLPVATVMVTYEVGSRNETVGTTGATHILEHMMFMGTDAHPTEDGSDYSSQMERIGARANATTYYDRTNYYATLPSEYVPLAIALEADRMRNLRLRDEDLAAEMTVVRNEFERGENNPVRTLVKEIFAAAFVAHPYGHPVIGWRSDIEGTSTEKLREFYDTFYWPENAVLSLIGGFDLKEALGAVVEHYGPVPAAPEAVPAVITEEPRQLGPRRVEIERAGQVGVVMIGNKVPSGTHPDWAALYLLQQILTADKNGRFYRALEDTGKANATFAFGPQLRDPGLFLLGAYLTPEAAHAEVEAIMLEEIEELAENGVTAEEVERAKSVIRASQIYGRDGPFAIADQLNDAIAIGDWTLYLTLPEAIEAATAEDVQRVAREYFIPRTRTTGWFLPSKSGAEGSGTGGALPGPPTSANPAAATDAGEGDEAAVDFLPPICMTARSHGPSNVVADRPMPVEGLGLLSSGSFAPGRVLSPAEFPPPWPAPDPPAMLDKGHRPARPASRWPPARIPRRLDRVFDAGAHSPAFPAKFSRPRTPGSGLASAGRAAREPAFDPDVLESVKPAPGRSCCSRRSTIPNTVPARAFPAYSYPAGHPNHTAPIRSALIEDSRDATSVDDLKSFHANITAPSPCAWYRRATSISSNYRRPSQKRLLPMGSGGRFTRKRKTGTCSPPRRAPNSSEIRRQDQRLVRVRPGTGLQRNRPGLPCPSWSATYILGGSSTLAS